jgi:hypothetical protein
VFDQVSQQVENLRFERNGIDVAAQFAPAGVERIRIKEIKHREASPAEACRRLSQADLKRNQGGLNEKSSRPESEGGGLVTSFPPLTPRGAAED